MSHHDSKQFSVAMMRFKNFSLYVQRQIDKILRSHKAYVRAYINDIIIFSQTLTEHLIHFHFIFESFREMRICLILLKSFLKYSIMSLLKEKINEFELIISQKKLKIISFFRFSQSFKELKIYLRLIECLRNYVSYYAQIVKFLQKRKTMLFIEITKSLSKTRKARSSSIFVINLTKN